VSDAALIRQDWLRLAPGLAEFVLEQGWWPDNGTKLDFAGCVGHNQDPSADAGAMRRWGKATLLLAQHAGALDLGRVRHLLCEHDAACAKRLGPAGCLRRQRLGSWAVELADESVPVVWNAVDVPNGHVFFPLVVGAELPTEWAEGTLPTPARLNLADCERLQTQFEQDACEFQADAALLRQSGEHETARRLAMVLMQRHVEQWQEECLGAAPMFSQPASAAAHRLSAADEEAAAYAFG
jgi:hypothetical protein